MRVRALLFASLRDIAGARALDVDLADGSTVSDLSQRLGATYPGLRPRLPLVRVAVNDALTDGARALADGDEVAYLPAVSGGSTDTEDAAPGQGIVEIVEAPISIDRVLGSVRRNDCGAVVLFLGTVRDSFQGEPVLGMEYEAHRALAEQSLREVASEARRRWPVHAISVAHRIGRLDLGEISVAVAVAAPHRGPAFEAGRYAIDTLKASAPIWKRELMRDEEVWIEGDERVPRPRPARKATT